LRLLRAGHPAAWKRGHCQSRTGGLEQVTSIHEDSPRYGAKRGEQPGTVYACQSGLATIQVPPEERNAECTGKDGWFAASYAFFPDFLIDLSCLDFYNMTVIWIIQE